MDDSHMTDLCECGIGSLVSVRLREGESSGVKSCLHDPDQALSGQGAPRKRPCASPDMASW